MPLPPFLWGCNNSDKCAFAFRTAQRYSRGVEHGRWCQRVGGGGGGGLIMRILLAAAAVPHAPPTAGKTPVILRPLIVASLSVGVDLTRLNINYGYPPSFHTATTCTQRLPSDPEECHRPADLRRRRQARGGHDKGIRHGDGRKPALCAAFHQRKGEPVSPSPFPFFLE